MATYRQKVYDCACEYLQSGISICPMALDGTKRPSGNWRQYMREMPSISDLEEWFLKRDHGIGVICGIVSGGLEVLDFDDGSLFEPWRLMVPDIVAGLTVVRTPSGGYHVIYRCSEIGRNWKIASDPSRQKQTLIESRGEGGLIVGVGSQKGVHPSGGLYVKEAGPDPWNPWTITPSERRSLWKAARTFNRDPEVIRQAVRSWKAERHPGASEGVNPVIAKFIERNPIASILERHGWKSRDGIHWTRPGKDYGTSATICHAADGTELVHIFTSSTSLPTRSLNAFDLTKELEFGGDNRAAYRAAMEGAR